MLTDQHLQAEYRELPRVFALARVLAPRELVPRYRLGEGHVRFFFDKTGYLHRRQLDIIAECLRRKFKVQHREPPRPIPGLDLDWEPTRDDHLVCLQRLQSKLHEKPWYYRHYGFPVPPSFYDRVPA